MQVHLSRLPLGAEFSVADERYVLVDWNVCSATVKVQKRPKLISITDRQGNDREFFAQQGSITRIAADLEVQVDSDTQLLRFSREVS